MFVDSHCHLHLIDYEKLAQSAETIVARAREAGVYHCLCVATEDHELTTILDYCQRFEGVSASMGVHPAHVLREELSKARLKELASHRAVIAIGETGLDYGERTSVPKAVQQARFRAHIQVAKALRKPLIIHTRNAKEDTLAILKEEQAMDIAGIFHCFTEDWPTAKAALDLGFYLSFSGILTFKNAQDLQAVAKQCPMDRILIETDSPYLAPTPYRGRSNEPAFVVKVAKHLASLKGLSLEAVALATSANFHRLFPSTLNG